MVVVFRLFSGSAYRYEALLMKANFFFSFALFFWGMWMGAEQFDDMNMMCLGFGRWMSVQSLSPYVLKM